MEFILVIPVIAWAVLWLWTLYDVARRPDAQWSAVGQSRIVWLLLILVLQFFGTLFYLVAVRPKLEQVAKAGGY